MNMWKNDGEHPPTKKKQKKMKKNKLIPRPDKPEFIHRELTILMQLIPILRVPQ